MLDQCHFSSLNFPPHGHSEDVAAPNIGPSHDDTPGSEKERGRRQSDFS